MKRILVLLLFCFSVFVVSCSESDGERTDSLAVDGSGIIQFTFFENSIDASKKKDAYEIDGTKLTIKEAGYYCIRGKCSKGSITIPEETANVRLEIQSLNLSCDYGAPLLCRKKSDVIVFLSGKSTLKDNENPEDEYSEDEARAREFKGAAIKVERCAKLMICGDGALNVDAAACKDGIRGESEAKVVIESGTVNVSADNDGISSMGWLEIQDADVNVEAGGDGIKSDPAYVLDNIDKREASFVGGTVKIKGGKVRVSAEGVAVKGASALEIGVKGSSSGPEIEIVKSRRGLEAAQLQLYSGTGAILSGEDGISAAYERFTNTDESDGGYRYANDLYSAFKEKYGDFIAKIDGGTWTVDAQETGLKSGGSVVISGGSTTVFGGADSSNAAIYTETGFELRGGTIFGIGRASMAEVPRAIPAGYSYYVCEPEHEQVIIHSGDALVVKDSKGNAVASAVAPRDASYVLYGLTESGGLYRLFINGVEYYHSGVLPNS